MSELKEEKVVSKYGGSVAYYKNGQLHREDGPAIEWRNGDRQLWVNGELWRDGDTEWWIDGKLHRENGPAIEWTDGTQMWFFNGKKHRLDGPAIDYANGHKEWWIDEVQYSEEEFNALRQEPSKSSKLKM